MNFDKYNTTLTTIKEQSKKYEALQDDLYKITKNFIDTFLNDYLDLLNKYLDNEIDDFDDFKQQVIQFEFIAHNYPIYDLIDLFYDTAIANYGINPHFYLEEFLEKLNETYDSLVDVLADVDMELLDTILQFKNDYNWATSRC